MSSKPIAGPNQGVSRRDVVAAAAALVACGSAAPIPASAGQNATIQALLSAIRDRGAAEEVGWAALQVFGRTASDRHVVSLLADLDLTRQNLLETSPDALRIRISRRVRDDFAAERTVTIDGWRLSLTEARLYALAARARA